MLSRRDPRGNIRKYIKKNTASMSHRTNNDTAPQPAFEAAAPLELMVTVTCESPGAIELSLYTLMCGPMAPMGCDSLVAQPDLQIMTFDEVLRSSNMGLCLIRCPQTSSEPTIWRIQQLRKCPCSSLSVVRMSRIICLLLPPIETNAS